VADITLEEVKVTARKREESLMEVPLSMIVVDGRVFTQEGLTNLEQLSPRVPGLVIGRGTQTSAVYIRGIGSGINKAFEQSAGMYIDGIYQPRSRQFTQSLFDLERVEVLRGPQSLLFGKNTIAGAISVETANPEPGQEFGGYTTLDYEPEYSTWRGTAVVSGSLSETLTARLSLRYQKIDGYVTNLFRVTDELARDDTLARLSLVWQPTDHFDATIKISRTRMEGLGAEITNPVVDASLLAGFQAGTNNLGITQVMGVIAALAMPTYQPSTGDHVYDSWLGNRNWSANDIEDTKSTQASLLMNWHPGNYTLTSLTGYSEFDFFQDHDVDFQPGNVIHNAPDKEALDLFSQEFRIASDLEGQFNFFGGLYYEHQQLVPTGRPTIDGTLGGVFGALPANSIDDSIPPGIPLSALGINSLWNGTLLAPGTPLAGVELESIFRTQQFDQKTETIAVFAEMTVDFTEVFAVDVGARYSKDRKKAFKGADLGVGSPDQPVVAINPDGTMTGNVDPLSAMLLSAIWGGSLNTYPHAQDLERNEHHFDPSARLRWNFSSNSMAYFSYATAYKSGGFNYTPDTSNPDGSPAPGTEYEDEQARTFELGLKSTLWNDRARFSAVVFHTDIENMQVTSFEGTNFKVGNAAKTTSKGFEAEGQAAISDSLEVGGSLAYLDHKFDRYETGPCTIYQIAHTPTGESCTQDFSGRRGPYAPEWSFTLYGDWEKPVFTSYFLGIRAEINYKDKMYLDQDLDSNTLQDAYYKVNGRIALSLPNRRWEVALYGRNLTDKATYSFMLDAPLGAGIFAGWIEEPRVIGAQFRFNF